MAERTQDRGIFAVVRSACCGAHRELVKRDFNAAVDTRKGAVPQTRDASDVTRAKVAVQPHSIGVYGVKLKPIAGGWSKQAGRRLSVGM